MRLIDADSLRGRVCEVFLCAEPGSAEERRFALMLGLIDSAPTITPPPNDPLTLDELREMDGEPVWVRELAEPGRGQWRIIKGPWYDVGLHLDGFGMLECEDTGKTWLAYRRKPEEVTL